MKTYKLVLSEKQVELMEPLVEEMKKSVKEGGKGASLFQYYPEQEEFRGILLPKGWAEMVQGVVDAFCDSEKDKEEKP